MQPIRKIAAILSADVVGYSRLMGDDDLATVADIVATRQLVSTHVGAAGGRLIDSTGDSMLADFTNAVDAVQCAVDVQRHIGERNAARPEHRRMRLRIGLNLGDILEQDAALYGTGVNIAARLQTLSEPGGVCISAAIHDLVEGRLPLAFTDAGQHVVKNLDHPLRIYHVRSLDFRPLSEHDLAVAMAWPGTPGPTNLPRPVSSFVGRQAELARLVQWMGTHRLVTLVGPGGVGKTRLSLQVAAASSSHHPDGVWFVDLAPVTDPDQVPQAVANVLEVKEEPSRSVVEALLAAVRTRRLLLVLDNCEHLAQACARLAAQLLDASPGLQLLSTSREPLRVAGELNFPVPALALPDAAARSSMKTLSACESVRLFVERASAVQPGFELSEANADAVIAICQQLDGIALAIELAAARVRSLSVHRVAERLHDRFRLLTGGERNVMPRQKTLRALIDWSFDLLSAGERALFTRLAVFVGGWTLEAAEAVAAGGEIEQTQVLDLMGSLVEKSLVVMERDGERYRLLETVRQYALERLTAGHDHDATRTAHLDYFLVLAERARAHLAGPQQGVWLAQLDRERENMLAALSWCDHAPMGATAGLRLMFALKLYLFNRGLLQTLRQGAAQALDRAGADSCTEDRCRVLHAAGQACYFLGRYDDAIGYLREALSNASARSDDASAAAVLQVLGMACLGNGDRPTAHRHLLHALELARQRTDRRELAAAVNAVAQLHRMGGELDEAEPLYEQALTLVTALQDHENMAVAAVNLAMVGIGRGDAERARVMLLQASRMAETSKSKLTVQYVLGVAAALAVLRKDWSQAATFHGAAEAQAALTGIHVDPADRSFLAPLWARAREALGVDAHARAEQAGAALDGDAALSAVRAWLQ